VLVFTQTANEICCIEFIEELGLMLIKSLIPSRLYALFVFPNLSAVKVAPLIMPLFSFPLESSALPLNGQYAIDDS